MNPPRMYDAIKPRVINQAWGTFNPAVYSQFGFTRHNGRDLALAADRKIYAPFDYTVVRRGYQPNGGGNFIGIISEPFEFPAFTCTTPEGVVIPFAAGTYQILTDLLHCETIFPNEGQKGTTGDLLAIGDNTGFSTGPHCHQQDRRVTWDGKVVNTVDVNEANNSFDPTQFLTGIYAQDMPTFIQKLLAVLPLLKALVEYYQGKK